MVQDSKCSMCGALLPEASAAGLCPQCLEVTGKAIGAQDSSQLPSTIQLAIPPVGEKPGDRIGRYKLLQEIGEGGCGMVFMADQLEPVKRRVALKVIKPGMDTKEVLARFEAERQALALMDHPHIAKVFDAGATKTGRPYFVMELVRGIRITHYCDENKLDTRGRVGLFIQVCQAIQHAHQKGIIHRDIKPSNILVADCDGAAAPKIIDFGIAKATAGQILTDKTFFTALEQFIGTPAYMSPEQAKLSGLDIDSRSDIYSLGVLLYELLTGKTPFDPRKFLEAGLAEIRRIIREEDPPRPSQKLSTLTVDEQTTTARARQTDPPRLVSIMRGDLDWIVMKCLEKDRTRRYQTASDLAIELKRYVDHEPIEARPPGLVYRARKLVRRKKTAFAAGLLVTACAAASFFVIVVRRPPPPATPQTIEQLLTDAGAKLEHFDREGFLSKALDELGKARAMAVDDHRVLAKLGWAHLLAYHESERDEERQEAFTWSSRAVSENKKDSLAHMVQGLVASDQHDWVVATNELVTANELERSGEPLILAFLASVCMDTGDAAGAGRYAAMAEQAADGKWQVFFRLGAYRMKTGDLRRAQQDFEEAERLAPEDPLPPRFLGQILLAQNNARSGLAEIEKSQRLRSSPQTLSALGSAYFAGADYEKAGNIFAKAAHDDPARYDYSFNAAISYLRVPNKKALSTQFFANALEKIGGTLKQGGRKTSALAYQGACQAGLGQVIEARANLAAAWEEGVQTAHDAHVRSVVLTGYEMLGETPPSEGGTPSTGMSPQVTSEH